MDKRNTVFTLDNNADVSCQEEPSIYPGPEVGKRGWRIVATGTPEQVARVTGSYTGHFIGEMLERERQRDGTA